MFRIYMNPIYLRINYCTVVCACGTYIKYIVYIKNQQIWPNLSVKRTAMKKSTE